MGSELPGARRFNEALDRRHGGGRGGPALLATLVVLLALVPLVLAWRLALFQRVLTPTVAGTVIMLIPITVLAAVGDLLTNVPPGSPAASGPLSALATVLVISGLTLKRRRRGASGRRSSGWAPARWSAAGSVCTT